MAPGAREWRRSLACHPASAAAPVREVSVLVRHAARGALEVTFDIRADLQALRIPAPRPPRRGDALWRHTCCEVFVARAFPAYHEFNFSPSGEWTAYAFRRYREREVGGAGSPAASPGDLRIDEGHLQLHCRIELEALSPLHGEAGLSLAVSAVMEDASGALSYWALRHPPGQPDFHHPDGFALCAP